MFTPHFSEKINFVLVIALLCVVFSFTESLAAPDKKAYLRIGAGMAWSLDSQFSDGNCASTSPAALFGCSTGNDGRSTGAYGDFGDSEVLDIGLGYRWNNWLRTEISLTSRPDFEFDGRSNFSQVSTDFNQAVNADLNIFSGMLIGSIEPMALFQKKTWKIKPLLIGGLGFSHNSIDAMEYTFPSTTTITPDGSSTEFAWTIGAGFTYDLSDSIELQLVYRYSDLGDVSTDVDTMTILRRSTGAIITNSITIDRTEADLEMSDLLLNVVWYF